MEKITYDDFAKLEIKIGTIKSVEVVPDTDKLLKLTVDLGEEDLRQIVSGIKSYFADPEVLVGKQSAFVTNMEPRTIRGVESNGMILAASNDDTFSLLVPDVAIAEGAEVK